MKILKIKDWLRNKRQPLDAAKELSRILTEELEKEMMKDPGYIEWKRQQEENTKKLFEQIRILGYGKK